LRAPKPTSPLLWFCQAREGRKINFISVLKHRKLGGAEYALTENGIKL
jgi:hypothetical protein